MALDTQQEEKKVSAADLVMQQVAHELAIDALLDLLAEVVDPRPCELDEPGWRCTTHGTRTPCGHGRALTILAKRDAGPSPVSVDRDKDNQ